MENCKLKETDREDIEDLIKKIEKSFNIKFDDGELKHIKTFGELCDYIINKIELENVKDCTSQQSFYKIRTAISEELNIENKFITPDTLLGELFPIGIRRSKIKGIENHLGIKLNVLNPPTWLIRLLVLFILVSIIEIFFSVLIGSSGVLISIIGIMIALKTGKEFKVSTAGQLSDIMVIEHYLQSRRNPKTINRKEIEILLTDWFSKDLHLDKLELQRDSKLR